MRRGKGQGREGKEEGKERRWTGKRDERGWNRRKGNGEEEEERGVEGRKCERRKERREERKENGQEERGRRRKHIGKKENGKKGKRRDMRKWKEKERIREGRGRERKKREGRRWREKRGEKGKRMTEKDGERMEERRCRGSSWGQRNTKKRIFDQVLNFWDFCTHPIAHHDQTWSQWVNLLLCSFHAKFQLGWYYIVAPTGRKATKYQDFGQHLKFEGLCTLALRRECTRGVTVRILRLDQIL